MVKTEVVSPGDQFKVEVDKTRTRFNSLRKAKPGNEDVEVINQELIALGRTKVKNKATLSTALSALKIIDQRIAKLEK